MLEGTDHLAGPKTSVSGVVKLQVAPYLAKTP